jgi:hypothetical protein
MRLVHAALPTLHLAMPDIADPDSLARSLEVEAALRALAP